MSEDKNKSLISSTIGYDNALYFDCWKQQQQQAATLFSCSTDQQSIYDSFYDNLMPLPSPQNFLAFVPSTQK